MNTFSVEVTVINIGVYCGDVESENCVKALSLFCKNEKIDEKDLQHIKVELISLGK